MLNVSRVRPVVLVPAVVALLVGTLVIATPATTSIGANEAFPEATPESQGMSSAALESLVDVVNDYIDRDMAVGAELLVIKNRHTVLHETFGWRDREAQVPMPQDALFNIRSMTKPITGAAIQILIDEGRLQLDDRAADYLPGFDNDAARDITIRQLLTHTSGLPLSIMTGTHDFESLQDIANAVGETGPQFEPGSKFWYSDAGADVLGAVVEVVSGSTLDDFVTERLLEPLGMADTTYAGDPGDPRLGRIATLYGGRPSGWTRVWSPESEPFYPFAWGSQSLYSTPSDYARFLAMWLDGGKAGDRQVLTPEAVARTLTPVVPMGGLGTDNPYPTRFAGLTPYHGQMAILYFDEEPPTEAAVPSGQPTLAGYSGSDGTIAWAWPQRDLMILYFTQSRGGATPLRLEAEIDRLLINPQETAAAPMPEAYAEYLGTYTANYGSFRNEPFEIRWRDGDLVLDIPSYFVFPLEPTDAADGWTFQEDPRVAVSFTRDETGQVTGLRIDQPGGVFDVPKGEPEPEQEVKLRAEDVARYLGTYRQQGTERDVEVVFISGSLALRVPELDEPLELFPPNEEGVWRVRMNPTVAIQFSEDSGAASSFVARGPGGEETYTKLEPSTSDPGE